MQLLQHVRNADPQVVRHCLPCKRALFHIRCKVCGNDGRVRLSEVALDLRGTVRGRVRGLRRGISTGDASESVQVGNRPAHLQCLGRLQGGRGLSWGACWCRRGTSWGRFEGLNSIPVCIRALDMDHLNEPMHSYSQPLPVFSFQACTGARCSHGCRALMCRLRLTTFRAACHASGIWRCCRSTLTAVVCEGGPETVHPADNTC